MPWPLTKVEGPSAYMRAAATMSAAGTPVMRLGDGRRILRGARGQLVEAVAPARDERLVVEPLRDQHVDHGQRQRGVRADARGEPQVGHLRRLRALGVDRR